MSGSLCNLRASEPCPLIQGQGAALCILDSTVPVWHRCAVTGQPGTSRKG